MIIVDYDAGTKMPGSANNAPQWQEVIDSLSASDRRQLISVSRLKRSLGQYIPAMVRMATSQALQNGEKPLLLGGDHSLSYSTCWAVREMVGPISILHCDAHHDSYDVPYISNYSFAFHGIEDFEHTWHGVGWRYDQKESASPRLVNDITSDYWLTFDFDYFDPNLFPHVAFPVPATRECGPDLDDFRATISRPTGRAIGADLLEWVPKDAEGGRDVVSEVLVKTIEVLAA